MRVPFEIISILPLPVISDILGYLLTEEYIIRKRKRFSLHEKFERAFSWFWNKRWNTIYLT